MGREIVHYDKTGATAITGKEWDDILAGTTGTAEKFWVENSGDVELGTSPLALIAELEAVGSNDGVDRMQWGLDVGSVSPPFEITIAEIAGSGVWAAPTTVYYRLTAINGSGESQGSREVTGTVSTITMEQHLTWTLPPGATGIKIYRSPTTGVYTTPALIATLGAVATYDDDGTTAGAGALPAANTTGGAAPNYGTAPALSAADLNFGTLAIGEARAYWVNREIPLASSEDGNDRMSRRHFSEV